MKEKNKQQIILAQPSPSETGTKKQELVPSAFGVSKYNKFKPIYLGADLFSGKRYDLSANAQKVLFTLAQSLDHSQDLFPYWEIDIRLIISALGFKEANNDRYDAVRRAIEEINSHPLTYRKSAKEWGSYSWFQECHFNGNDSMNVKIKFSDSVKDYLLCFKRYVEIKPQHYGELSLYALYLYPMLKNELYLSKKHSKYETIIEKDINALKEFMYCDKIKSYSDTTNFLVNAIGIQREQRNDDENASKWKYATKKVGDKQIIISPIHEINTQTDITVVAEPIKKGNAYKSIRFTIQLKSEAAEQRKAKNKENAIKQAIAETDVKKNQNNSDFEVVSKYHQSVVMKNANEANMPITKFAKLAGYTKKGEWYIKYKKKDAKSIQESAIQSIHE